MVAGLAGLSPTYWLVYLFSDEEKEAGKEEEEPLTGEEEEERRIAEMGKPMLGDHPRVEVIIEESYEFKVCYYGYIFPIWRQFTKNFKWYAVIFWRLSMLDTICWCNVSWPLKSPWNQNIINYSSGHIICYKEPCALIIFNQNKYF